MRHLRGIFLSFVFVCLFAVRLNAQKEIFIKEIDFELTSISDIDYENEYFLTLKLTKGTHYVFSVINHINDASGVAILELLDADNLILTNELNDKYYETVNFNCSKTAFYDILIRFKDNDVGHSRIDISMIQ